jgi:hypothetical protein
VDAFEGILQRAWDRELSRKPVLLILIGSDLSMMEALSSYGRPFHQRGKEMVLGPLNPAEVGEMLRLEPADAFDAALVTGGLPLICAAWRPVTDLWPFLASELTNRRSSAGRGRACFTTHGEYPLHKSAYDNSTYARAGAMRGPGRRFWPGRWP